MFRKIFRLLMANLSVLKLEQTVEKAYLVTGFDEGLIAKLVIDWDQRFPLSGDIKACEKFKDIINADLFNGNRVSNSYGEVLDLISSGLVILEPIVEFQNQAKGKVQMVNRKMIIVDPTFDQVPYGTLSKLIKNDPKTCLKAYRIAVNDYMMKKYNISRFLSSGVYKGKISAVPNGVKICKKDDGRVVELSLSILPIPHYLGCSCSIVPIVTF